MGRPATKIDAEEVRKLAALGCTQDEIGRFFGIHRSRIGRRFARELELGRGECEISLRRKQIEMAMGGSVAMAIHLGKNMLGQTDRAEVTSRDVRGSAPDEATVASGLKILESLGYVRAIPPPSAGMPDITGMPGSYSNGCP
jgi:hypothetical protein